MKQEVAMPRLVLAAILGQTLLSAGTHLAAKEATHHVAPMLLVTLRLLFSAAVFIVLLLVTPGPKLPPRGTWTWVALYGFLAGPMNQGLFMYGLVRSKATHGGLLYALTPIGVYLLAIALKRERGEPRRFFGIAVAFAGVAVLLLGRGLSEALGPLVGDLFIIGAVLAWVFFTTGTRPFAAQHGGLRTSAWSLIAGAVFMLPFAPFTITTDALAAIAPTGWACLAYLVLMTSVVSYVLWNYALARVDASRVAVFANLQPIVTALAAWLVLDEPLGWSVFVGGGLVLIGVRLAQR